MYVVLLRLALGLYSVRLLHSVLTVLNKQHTIFKTALVAVTVGFALHVTSIIVLGMEVQYLPITQRYEAFSFFGALVALGFLSVSNLSGVGRVSAGVQGSFAVA